MRASTTTRVRLYIYQYVRTRSRPELQRYVRFDRVGPDCWALPCVRRCSWWVPAVRGKRFFHEIRWPVRWVPAVRWRNNYFAHDKEALPCCGRGPSCQPLHVQSTSDGSCSLTTLTTPRREHQGGGRRRGLGRGRRGAGEDATLEARAERSMMVHYFSCGVRLPSPQNNRGCG